MKSIRLPELELAFSNGQSMFPSNAFHGGRENDKGYLDK